MSSWSSSMVVVEALRYGSSGGRMERAFERAEMERRVRQRRVARGVIFVLRWVGRRGREMQQEAKTFGGALNAEGRERERERRRALVYDATGKRPGGVCGCVWWVGGGEEGRYLVTKIVEIERRCWCNVWYITAASKHGTVEVFEEEAHRFIQ